MLNLNFVNYALAFYKLSSDKNPIVPFALMILNKIKSLNFLFDRFTVQTKSNIAPMFINSTGHSVFRPLGRQMKLKPLFNRVIIIPENTIKISMGGIMLPETAVNSVAIGIISEASDGLPVKIGHKVLYNQNASSKYSLNGNIIDILDVTEVLAIVHND